MMRSPKWAARHQCCAVAGEADDAVDARGLERFCRLFDEIRVFLLPQSQRNQSLSLARRRDIHQKWFTYLLEMMAAA
jgi:hypothetical protein